MEDRPKSFKPVSGNVMPRFSGIPTFMRLPHVSDPADVDIGLIGVPWDGGTTNRAGARHGPRRDRHPGPYLVSPTALSPSITRASTQ